MRVGMMMMVATGPRSPFWDLLAPAGMPRIYQQSRIPICAPTSPCWHARNFEFIVCCLLVVPRVSGAQKQPRDRTLLPRRCQARFVGALVPIFCIVSSVWVAQPPAPGPHPPTGSQLSEQTRRRQNCHRVVQHAAVEQVWKGSQLRAPYQVQSRNVVLETMAGPARPLTDLLMVLDTLEWPTRPHPALNPHVAVQHLQTVLPLWWPSLRAGQCATSRAGACCPGFLSSRYKGVQKGIHSVHRCPCIPFLFQTQCLVCAHFFKLSPMKLLWHALQLKAKGQKSLSFDPDSVP